MAIFLRPRRTNFFWSKRRTCPPKGGRMVTLNIVEQKQLHTNFFALKFDEVLWPTGFVLCDLE